jgi:hypothetical protein
MERLTRQFDLVRSLNYETCPGEEECESKPKAESVPPHRIYQIRELQPDAQIEQICAGCRFKETKPGSEPSHLLHALQVAYELEEDDMICGGFDYPAILDHLDPLEWACIAAIKHARKASENKATNPQKEPQASITPAHSQHLQRLSKGY